MNTVRMLVLLLAGSVLCIGGSYAYGQAEVDPDHFEPTVHVATAPKSATSMQHSKRHSLHMTASRHAARHRRHHAHALA